MKSAVYYFLFLIVTTLFTGCANTFDVRKVDYIPPPSLNNNEVRIYVFRENSSFGRARKLSVINNDTVVGVLLPATYTHYTAMGVENEVVIYMSPSPLSHFRVKERHGENIYLFFRMGYLSGMYLEEISREKAEELMINFKYTEIGIKGSKAKMDYKQYYDDLYE